MAFSSIWRQINQFGACHCDFSSSFAHSDAVITVDGSTKYYNKDMPIAAGYDSQKLNAVNPWHFYSEPVVEDTNMYQHEVASYSKSGTLTYNTYNVSQNGLTIRLTITNSGSTDMVIKSVGITRGVYLFSSSSGGSSASSNNVLAIYVNLTDFITVPANDSIFVDITLSAGDIQSVQQG